MDRLLKPVTALAPSQFWPPGVLDAAAAERLFFTNLRISWTPRGLGAAFGLAATGEVGVNLPGPGGFRLLMVPAADRKVRYANCLCTWSDQVLDVTLEDTELSLWIPPAVLTPLQGEAESVRIPLRGSITLTLEHGVDAYPALAEQPHLPPSLIGETGLAISAGRVLVDLSRVSSPDAVTSAGLKDDFVGLFAPTATLRMPPWLELDPPQQWYLENCAVEAAGVSGRVDSQFQPRQHRSAGLYTGAGAGRLFGMPAGLDRVALTLVQGAIAHCDIRGRVLLPHTDEESEVSLILCADGGVLINLARQSDLRQAAFRPGQATGYHSVWEPLQSG